MAGEVSSEHIQHLLTPSTEELASGADVKSRGQDFAARAERLKRFSESEIAAYGLFTQVALATLKDGAPARRVFLAPPAKGQTSEWAYTFPSIEYDSAPSDIEQPRRITLRAVVHLLSNEVQHIVPVLDIYPTEPGFWPEYTFKRTELSIVTGYPTDSSTKEDIYNVALNPELEQPRKNLYDNQAQYIKWLMRAAECIGVPPILASPDITDASGSGGLAT
ncbi:MAG TPA: hypothetical protein VLG16_01335 [Candidatus Saccharimonadales bacterium]|nr:hypothetical protein [Candidatus Saccharimonadales bacterium]